MGLPKRKPIAVTEAPAAPTVTEPAAPRGRFISWLLGGIAAALLYRATRAPGLLWGDSGEAQLHTLLSGWLVDGQIVRSHVLYYALSRALTWIPGIDAVTAANNVSVIGGAATIANMAWLLRSVCQHKFSALCGVLLLLGSHTLWQLSTSAEVLSLSTALFSTELVAIVKLLETGKMSWLALGGLANGLGVSNHNFALLTWPVYGIMALRWWFRWSGKRTRAAAAGGIPLAIGLIPIGLLCITHFREVQSVYETVKSFLVGNYADRAFNWGNLPRLLGMTAGATAMNFPTPLLLLAPLGVLAALRLSVRPIAWLLVGAALVYWGFGARYNVADQHTFLVPGFMLLVVFIALGLDRLRAWIVTKARAAAVLGMTLLPPIAYAVAPPVLSRFAPQFGPMPDREVPYRDRFDWFLRPWRSGTDGPERFARETLYALPQDAWLVTDSTLCPPLNYLQVAENLRTDVRLDSVVARQDWFGKRMTEDALQVERDAKLAQGQLFTTSDQERYLPCWMRGGKYRFERVSHVYRAIPIEREDQ